jgi:sugar lactone lactonase YvrE
MNDSASERPAGVEPVLAGRALVESTRWHRGRIWFADWGAGEIVALDPTDGNVQVVACAPAPPLSFDFLADGRPIIVGSRLPHLLRCEPDGELTVHADLSALGAGWNEIVVDGRGNIYVNGGNTDPRMGNIDLVLPDGTARRVAEGARFPNGMAITPDNRTLILAESHGRCLTAFDIEADGSLSRRRLWAALGQGAPDGICIDAEGAVWCADVPNRCCVRVAEGGTILQRVELDRGAFACMLGGAERRTLYIAAAEWFGMERMAEMAGSGQILRVDVRVAGAGWPQA